jgi:tetratricopeptide (TPR) repeat protein
VSSPLDASLRQFARAISPSNDQQAEILYFQSRIKQRFGYHNAARQLAEAAVETNPKKAAYRLQLASVLSDELNKASFFKKMSIVKRIRRQLDSAVKLEPRNPDCLFGMMMYYEQAPGVLGGGKNKAHQLAEQIGRINRSEGYLAEAQLAQMENRSGELEDLYLKAVEADPISFDALASLAGFYGSEAQKKKYELANKYAWVLDLSRK